MEKQFTVTVLNPASNPFRIDLPNIVFDSNVKTRGSITNKGYYVYLEEGIIEKGLPANAPWFIQVKGDLSTFFNQDSNKTNLLSILPKWDVFNNTIHQYRIKNSPHDKVSIGRKDTIELTLVDQNNALLVLSDYSLVFLKLMVCIE